MVASLRPLVLCLVLLGLAACTSPIHLVDPPVRKADLYPRALRSDGLVVAVDQISDRERVVRYFGVDLREFGIVPAQVLITNNGRRSVTIEPADVLVSESQRVIDPLPPGYVAELAVEAADIGGESADALRAHVHSLALVDSVVPPGETLGGFVFFDAGIEEPRELEYFRLVSLYSRSGVRLRMAVTETGSGQRLHFGPFPLER